MYMKLMKVLEREVNCRRCTETNDDPVACVLPCVYSLFRFPYHRCLHHDFRGEGQCSQGNGKVRRHRSNISDKRWGNYKS